MHQPWTLALHTQRLLLRPLQPDDYAAWYQGYADRLPQQSPYDPGRDDLTGCDQAWFAALCRRHQALAAADDVYIWGIFDRHTTAHLGHVDISTIRRAENQWANLGYGIHNQYWRQGFAKEAVAAALRAGFEHLGYHRIEAAINLDNAPSIALARTVGLVYECLRRGFYFENEEWVDHLIYAAIPADVGLPEPPPSDHTP